MNVLVRIRYIQARRLVPSVNPRNPRYARRKVSWTRSSASEGLRVRRRAAEYRLGSSGMASRSNRSLSAASSPLEAPDVSDVETLSLNDGHLVISAGPTILRRGHCAGLGRPG